MKPLLLMLESWWLGRFRELILLDKPVCCSSSSSCCCVSFVKAPTKFFESVELTSLKASLVHLSLCQSSKNTIWRLATAQRSCTVAASFWYSSFLLIKFGMAFVKISLILLFRSLTALSSTAWLASRAFWTLSVSACSFDGLAGGIGCNTGSG